MDEDYNLYQNQADSFYTLRFDIDISLLDILRSFEHKNHEFKEGYLESIFTLLYYYQGKPETEMFQQFLSNNGGPSIEALIFSVHYYFASILSLEPLLKVLGQDSQKVIALSKSDINKTNILNVHSITDRQGLIDHQILVQKSKEVKPKYLPKFQVCITTSKDGSSLHTETNTLFLDYFKISLSIKTKGKLDPYVVSHIANILNKAYDIELYHVLLQFFANKRQATENYDEKFTHISQGLKDFKFDKEKFHIFRDRLSTFSLIEDQFQKDEVSKLLSDIDQIVCQSVIARDIVSNRYLEKLLIGAMGHPHQAFRDISVILLNVLYDGVDWQRSTPYKPSIAKVGQKFTIEYLFELEEQENPNAVVLLLKSFIFDNKCQQNVISWHKPKLTEQRVQGQPKGKKYFVFQMDFGKFKRCGFYDWKLIRLTTSGKLNSVKKIMNFNHLESSANLKQFETLQESKPIQGRIIVQPGFTKNLQIHEIYVDLLDAKPDKQGQFTKRGNFKKVKEKLPDLLDSGINCVYLMGALERDNGLSIDPHTQQKSFMRPEVSPLAITCRRSMNTMLGGKKGFLELMQKAKELNIKILIDSVIRVSSARHHKRYRKYLINQLDKDNKLVTLFGTDGRSQQFEDTTVLNYRKQKVWNLYLEEVQQLREEFGINGIHLDNCQAWPQIFTLDVNEMYRTEIDGETAYTRKQIFEGHVVQHKEDSGFWGSSVKDTYANPFLIRLCRRMWEKYPDFLIVGEAWGAMGGQEEREINLVQSGIVPRLFKLPIAIASILGENLRKDGTVTSMERQNVNLIKKWFEQTRKEYPRGSILIQSTTYHPWPYLSLIFKRGTWAAIDLFFTLNDIPMTFMGEQDGHAFREKTTTIFSQASDASKDIKLHDPSRKDKKKENKNKRNDSILMSQSTDDLGFGYNTYGKIEEQLSQSLISPLKLKPEESRDQGEIIRVQSGASLSQMELSQIEMAQENFRKLVGPQFGFDLQLIGRHYTHRRQMRDKYKVLRKGKMISLSAEHLHGWHTHVLAFARYTKTQMALVAINFNDGEVNLYMNLKNLKYQFPDYENSDVVVQLKDWNYAEKDQKDDSLNYYYIGELINDRLEVTLKNFKSQIWGLEIFCNDKAAQLKADNSSMMRLQRKINQTIPQVVWSNDTASRLIQLANKSSNLQMFVNGYLHFFNNVLLPNDIDLNKLLSQMKIFQDDKTLLCNFFSWINSTINLVKTIPDIATKLPFYASLEDVVEQNKLGPICLLCPELGKWTTTGGLGVMVDELTQELAKMNEEVMVISPYYERNKKGETGYLEKDGFKYLENFDIWINGSKYILGVHHGVVNGVTLYWLHNPDLFPTAYAGEDPKYIMKQLTGFAKGSLQMLCTLNIIPSVLVTNDWFCGLVPAYMRDSRFFGKTFNGTKSFHIVHNLDPLYEGRLYPKPNEGTLDYIHELPNEMLIDPFWTTRVVNPSRCALLNCDNWGTVSQSYKIELLRDSPLSPVLRKHNQPFAFPNGIRRAMRLQLIVEKTNNDHLAAKEILQKKYFGCTKLMDNIPVFGFVGRITKQKGVHLIIDIAEELIQTLQGKIHILVGGPADMREPYSAECANKLYRLKSIYPANFWADPEAFFMDGTLVNVGCDFGLMPSAFEPGGIVQHEFFIGSTPVIAFKTGGLKDTVHEYDMKHMKGSGFTFEQYSRGDFMFSVQRAINVFKDPIHYKQLRKNSFDAAIDVADVGRAWAQEFYRLFKKNFIDKEFVKEQIEKLDQCFILEDVKEDDTIFKKHEGRVFTSKDETRKNFERILSAATQINQREQIFTYKTDRVPQPMQIFLSGTFDGWKERHRLRFDQFSKTWNISLNLPQGEYFYKFLVDNDWVCSEDDLKDNDIYGNINNFIVVE